MTLLIADDVNLLRGDFSGGGNGYISWWLATCARKTKVPGSSPAASYVQR